MSAGFDITPNPGFRMTFKNGNTVSVQWGPGNYCENRDLTDTALIKHSTAVGCEDAEIAAWNEDNVWYDFGHDEVKGWCTPDDVASFIGFVATCTSDFKPTSVSNCLNSKYNIHNKSHTEEDE